MSKEEFDKLNELEDRTGNENLPKAYRKCKVVQKVTQKNPETGEERLPIYLGINHEGDILFSMGGDNPYVLDEESVSYLEKSISVLRNALSISEKKEVSKLIHLSSGFTPLAEATEPAEPDEPTEKAKSVIENVKLKELSSQEKLHMVNEVGMRFETLYQQSETAINTIAGATNRTDAEEYLEAVKKAVDEAKEATTNLCKDFIDKNPEATVGDFMDNLNKNSDPVFEKAKKHILDYKKSKLGNKSIEEEVVDELEATESDMSQVLDNLSPEEKEELAREKAAEMRKQVFDKAAALEKELLGEIKTEPNVSYDYEHFNKIFLEKGTAALKEELAKLPKEERKPMIDKIVAEHKSLKQ